MTTETIPILPGHEYQVSPEQLPFNATAVLAGAALSGFLGGTVALLVTALVGMEWSMSLVVAPQLALSFSILGAWAMASFTQDDRDDVAQVPQPPIASAPLPEFVKPLGNPRIAS